MCDRYMSRPFICEGITSIYAATHRSGCLGRIAARLINHNYGSSWTISWLWESEGQSLTGHIMSSCTFSLQFFFSLLSHGIENMRGSNEAIRGEDGVVDRRAHELNLHVLQFLALLRKDYLIR